MSDSLGTGALSGSLCFRLSSVPPLWAPLRERDTEDDGEEREVSFVTEKHRKLRMSTSYYQEERNIQLKDSIQPLPLTQRI